FAPLLLFFIISGSFQTFHMHEQRKKGSYVPPKILKSLAQVHMHQSLPSENNQWPRSSEGFKILVLFMSLGLGITVLLGVYMAFKYAPGWMVWVTLISGFLIPIFLLWAAKGFK
ncbi:MAG: hypothetical protein KC684_07630, partial [Candidatus Omnitrophica bacterium]|nr:hypothetical protein [Candidatus Omnitrophota bacterium]